MNELGIVINKKGEYISFGTWVPKELRDKKKDSHWHDHSFKNEVHGTEWFKNLEISLDESQWINSQYDLLIKNGIITIFNIKNEENNNAYPALQIISPHNITSEQIIIMDLLREKLISWAKDYFCFIDIMDQDAENVLYEFNNINDYYEYLDKQKENKFSSKR